MLTILFLKLIRLKRSIKNLKNIFQIIRCLNKYKNNNNDYSFTKDQKYHPCTFNLTNLTFEFDHWFFKKKCRYDFNVSDKIAHFCQSIWVNTIKKTWSNIITDWLIMCYQHCITTVPGQSVPNLALPNCAPNITIIESFHLAAGCPFLFFHFTFTSVMISHKSWIFVCLKYESLVIWASSKKCQLICSVIDLFAFFTIQD